MARFAMVIGLTLLVAVPAAAQEAAPAGADELRLRLERAEARIADLEGAALAQRAAREHADVLVRAGEE